MSILDFTGNALTVDDISAYAPALPFGTDKGSDETHSYDPSVDPNLVIVGSPGAGKTHIVDLLAAAAHIQGDVVLGISASGTNDGRFDEFASSLDSAEPIALNLHQELRAREAACADAGVATVDELEYEDRPPRIVLFVDGLTDLRLSTPPIEGSVEECEAEYRRYLYTAIALFARNGSRARIHVVFTAYNEHSLPTGMSYNTAVLRRGNLTPADTGQAAFYDDIARYTGFQNASPIDVHVWSPYSEDTIAEMTAQ